MTGSTKGSTAEKRIVEIEKVKELRGTLQKLKPIPQEKRPTKLSRREAVEQLRETLEESLKKGYDYGQLSKILKENGLSISPKNLREILQEGKPQNDTGKSEEANNEHDAG
jgi:transposase